MATKKTSKKVSKRKVKARSGVMDRVVKKATARTRVGKKKVIRRAAARKSKAKPTPLQNAIKICNQLSKIEDILKDLPAQEIKLIKEHFPRQSHFPRKSKDVIFQFKSVKRVADKERDITVTWRY